MRVIRFFRTRSAAQAFADGVAYVNDSAIRDVVVQQTDARQPARFPWAVVFEDDDRQEDGDTAYEADWDDDGR